MGYIDLRNKIKWCGILSGGALFISVFLASAIPDMESLIRDQRKELKYQESQTKYLQSLQLRTFAEEPEYLINIEHEEYQ